MLMGIVLFVIEATMIVILFLFTFDTSLTFPWIGFALCTLYFDICFIIFTLDWIV